MARLQRQKSNNNLEPLMYLPLRGNLNGTDRNGSFTATTSGPVRWKPRAGGTINLIENPQNDPSGPNYASFNATIGQSTTVTKDGTPSISVDGTGGGMAAYKATPYGWFTEGEVVTLSAYVRGESAGTGAGVRFLALNSSGTTIGTYVGDPVTVLDDGWTLAEVTATLPAGTSALRYYFRGELDSLGNTLYFCQPMLEKSATASPYIDGDSENCQWINLNTYMSRTAHASASAEVEYFAEEATTNYVHNPRAAVNVSGVSMTGTGATLTRVAGSSSQLDSDYVFRASTAGVDGTEVVNWMMTNALAAESPLAANTSLTISFDVVINSGSKFIPCIQWNYGETTPLTDRIGDFTLGVPERYVFTVTIPAGTTVTSLGFLIFTRTGGIGDAVSFDISNIQVEKKAYATSYCDGSLGTGYSWAGTAHASASNREMSRVIIDHTNHIDVGPKSRGAVYTRWYFERDTHNNSYPLYMGGSAGIMMGRFNTSAAYYSRVGGSGGTNGVFLTATPHIVGLEWDESGVRSTIDGVTVDFSNTPPNTSLKTGPFYVALAEPNTQSEVRVSDVVIFNRPLTQGERERLVAMPSWDYDVLFTQPSGLERTRYTTKLQREAQGDSRKLVRAIRSPQLVRSAHTKESPMLFFDSGNGSTIYQVPNNSLPYGTGGAIRYVPAKDARVNLIKNPSFETNTTYWTAQNTALLERTNEVAYDGQYSCKVTITGTTSPAIVYGSGGPVRVDPGKTYTFSAYFYNPYETERKVWLSFYQTTRAGNTISGISPTNGEATLLPKQWTRLSVTRTMVVGAEDARMWVYHRHSGESTADFAVGEYFYIDAAMIEETPSPNDYFTGLWWNKDTEEIGTPHSSESVTYLARHYLEDTVNYIRNPSFEYTSTHWGSGSMGTVIERDTTKSFKGVACGKIYNTLGNNPVTSCVNQMPVANGTVCSVQARILGTPGSTAKIRFRVLNAGSTTIKYVDGPDVVMDGTWQLLHHSYQVDEPDATSVTLYFSGNDIVNPYYIDAAQIEQKRAPTAYVDGSMGAGTAWLGSAHSANSTRAQDTITYFSPAYAPNPARGSFAAWVYVREFSEYQHLAFIGSYNNPQTNCLQLYFERAPAKNLIFSWYNANVEIRVIATTEGIPSNAWNFVYAEWDEAYFALRVNHGAVVSASTRTYYPDWGISTGMYMGPYFGYGGGIQANSYFFDRPLTEAEQLALYNNPRSGATVFAQKPLALRRD